MRARVDATRPNPLICPTVMSTPGPHVDAEWGRHPHFVRLARPYSASAPVSRVVKPSRGTGTGLSEAEIVRDDSTGTGSISVSDGCVCAEPNVCDFCIARIEQESVSVVEMLEEAYGHTLAIERERIR